MPIENGVIIRGVGGLYTVRTDSGLVQCKARGIFRRQNIVPLPGDNVSVSYEIIEDGVINDIEQRHNWFIRPALANIDTILIVAAAADPEPDFLLIDKLLVMAAIKGIKSVLCINKLDLDEGHHKFKRIAEAYSHAGCVCLGIDTVKNRQSGLEALRGVLTDKGVVMLSGQSGTGKSTITNLLHGREYMKMGELSEKVHKGKNTTRHAELIEIDINGSIGYIADTPGFTNFVNDDIYKCELADYYNEYKPYKDECRYGDCKHIHEPDCAVKAGVEAGIIDSGRYRRYIDLYEGLKNNKWE